MVSSLIVTTIIGKSKKDISGFTINKTFWKILLIQAHSVKYSGGRIFLPVNLPQENIIFSCLLRQHFPRQRLLTAFFAFDAQIRSRSLLTDRIEKYGIYHSRDYCIFPFRDVMWQGTTDDGCVALAELLGWKVTALLTMIRHAILLGMLVLLRSDLFLFFEI